MIDFTISLLTNGFKSGIKIAELIGILESLNSKIDRMMQMPLNSGFIHIKNAESANSIERKNFFIDEAYTNFVNALTTEKNERLFLAYFGYIFCLDYMNQTENLKRELEKFSLSYFQVKYLEKQYFKEEFLRSIKVIFSSLIKIKYWRNYIEELAIGSVAFCLLIFKFSSPQYIKIRHRYFKNKDIKSFSELQNRINYCNLQKNILKDMIKFIIQSKTEVAKDLVISFEKSIELIEKQLLIFRIQEQAYNYSKML